MDNKHICAGVEYDGLKGPVSSDLCFEVRVAKPGDISDKMRHILHAALDEWLNQSHGTGCFWVGHPDEVS